MTLAQFLIVAAIFDGVFGLGFLLLPGAFFEPFGVAFNPAGEMVARVFGSALVALALVYWWMRREAGGAALQAVLRGSALYNAISVVPLNAGVLGGVTNVLGWIPVTIHLLLAAGFAYFSFQRR